MTGWYYDVPVLDVAALCGLKLKERTLDKAEVEAWCPFCPTESTDYHLHINPAKNKWQCFKCGARGNGVMLYARITGVDNLTAVEQLKSRFVGKFQACRSTVENAKPLIAPLHVRHDVYYDMLELMPLYEKHRDNLSFRGLDSGRIAENLYRSVPPFQRRRQIAAELSKRYDLRGVPGFYWDGEWLLYGKEGILFPALDGNGYIQGCQIRLDHPPKAKRRFRWLSSNPDFKKTDGSAVFPYGTATSGWIHVTGNTESDTVTITEGGMKGDIASYFLGDALFVCVPGVSALKHLPSVLQGLPCLRQGVPCYDMDMLSNRCVMEALWALAGLMQAMGLPCRMASWNRYKGIDDALLMESVGNPADICWSRPLPWNLAAA